MGRYHTLIVLAWMTAAVPVWASGNFPATAPAGTSSERHDAERKAERTLDDLRRAYCEKDLQGFMRNVSDAAYFSVTDLEMRLGTDLSGLGQVDLNLVVDHALTEGDKVLISTHWQKRAVRRSTGEAEISRGSTEFVFIEDGAEMKLLDQKNDQAF